jgi:hypothetical protein
MRTATLSVLFAAILAATPQQDPKKPNSDQPNQQKPVEAPLSVLCAPATTFQLGVAYNSSVIASGGTGSYQFALSGTLPAGIGINTTTGVISGTPTADGAFAYTVQVTDSSGAIATTGSTPCTLQLPVVSSPAATPAPEPAANPPAETTAVTKPPVIPQPEIDPAKLAEPRDKALEKAALGVHDDHPFISGLRTRSRPI